LPGRPAFAAHIGLLASGTGGIREPWRGFGFSGLLHACCGEEILSDWGGPRYPSPGERCVYHRRRHHHCRRTTQAAIMCSALFGAGTCNRRTPCFSAGASVVPDPVGVREPYPCQKVRRCLSLPFLFRRPHAIIEVSNRTNLPTLLIFVFFFLRSSNSLALTRSGRRPVFLTGVSIRMVRADAVGLLGASILDSSGTASGNAWPLFPVFAVLHPFPSNWSREALSWDGGRSA